MILQWAASNTVIPRTLVDEDKRGRVMSLFAMAIFGSVPIGSLISGALADRVGAQNTILAGGVVVVVASGVFLPRAASTCGARASTPSTSAWGSRRNLRAGGAPEPSKDDCKPSISALTEET